MGGAGVTVALQINGLSKRYGDRQAVDALDLSAQAGEIYALLGPNGAGQNHHSAHGCGAAATRSRRCGYLGP